MLFGSAELTLEPILTGGEVGSVLWVEVGGKKCRVELKGLKDVGIAEGVVVVGGGGIDKDEWLVVELTSEEGSVVEMSMALEGIMGPEGVEEVEDGLCCGEIYCLLLWQQTYQAAGSRHVELSWIPIPMESGAERLENRPRVHPA